MPNVYLSAALPLWSKVYWPEEGTQEVTNSKPCHRAKAALKCCYFPCCARIGQSDESG